MKLPLVSFPCCACICWFVVVGLVAARGAHGGEGGDGARPGRKPGYE
jgi:hypothetical protein